MAEVLTLMEFVALLSADEGVRSDFATDPGATLSAHGLDDLGPDDVQDAIVLVEDVRTVNWSDAYGSGSSHDDTVAFGSGAAGSAPAADPAGDDTDAGVPAAGLAGAEPHDDPFDDTGGVPGPDPAPPVDVDDVLLDGVDLPFG